MSSNRIREKACYSQRKMSTISSTSVLSFLTWSRLATVTIGTYWSLSIWEMRYMSLARFSLRDRGEVASGGQGGRQTQLRSFKSLVTFSSSTLITSPLNTERQSSRVAEHFSKVDSGAIKSVPSGLLEGRDLRGEEQKCNFNSTP